MEKNSRVALTAQPGLIGKIAEIDRRDVAEIVFEGGGRGRFPLGELQPVADDAPSKGWPPQSYETKLAPG